MSGLCAQHQLIGSRFSSSVSPDSLGLSSGLALVRGCDCDVAGLKATVCTPIYGHTPYSRFPALSRSCLRCTASCRHRFIGSALPFERKSSSSDSVGGWLSLRT